MTAPEADKPRSQMTITQNITTQSIDYNIIRHLSLEILTN